MHRAGVTWAVTVAVDLEHLPGIFSLVEDHDNLFCSVGVHPNRELEKEPGLGELCELASHTKCVAIGETGMDFFRHHVSPERQEERFRTHIRAAKRLEKPVIVHNRDADDAVIRILKEERVETCGGVMHCFSSGWETARQALDLGLSISFSGNVTFRTNDDLREVARNVPEEMLLIETDSPYLAPVPRRGRRNEPAYVRHVAECLAGVRQLLLESLAEITTVNAMQRFAVG